MKRRLALIVMCAACGGGDGGAGPDQVPLLITSMSPTSNATNVEVGAVVTATFNQPVDAATITPSSFLVKVQGAALPASVSYDPATRTARAVVPLLPDTAYQVEATTGIRTPSGSGLASTHSWTFTTREWQAVTVDTAGTVGFQSSLTVDEGGRLHVTYMDSYDSWNFKYATCTGSCAGAANWQVTTVDTVGSVGENSSLVVDAAGRLHVSYAHSGNGDVKYATCAANCATQAGWQTVTIDGELTSVGPFTALAVDAAGRAHVAYNDDSNGNLKYATCASSCLTAANWQIVAVDASGSGVQATSIAVHGSGRVHVAYYDLGNRDLEYATCAGACATAASWQTTTVDAAAGLGFDASLAVEASGRAHIAWYDSGNHLKYATCGANCATPASWQVGGADAFGDVGWMSSLDVDGDGRVHVAYYYNIPDVLKYGTCATACANQGNWRTKVVDSPSVGTYPSIVVDRNGAVHATYHDLANASLKYIR